MAATLNLTATSSDLVAYLTNWADGFTNHGNGSFYNADSDAAYEQWGVGNSGGNGVVLNGEMTYSTGSLGGTIDTMDFGSNYSGAGPYSVTSALGIVFGDTTPTAAFNQAIYTLSHSGSFTGGTFFGQSFDGLFDYFGDVGTVQNGTSDTDVLYSFDGNDVLNGGAGVDVFVFDRSIAGSLAASIGNDSISDFVTGSAGDAIDLVGLSSTSFDTFSEVYAAASQVGSDTVIDFGSLGTITLDGVTTTALVADNFLFA